MATTEDLTNLSPEQIEEILSWFLDSTRQRQYIGARYLPILGRKGEDTIEWDNGAPYEQLTIVMHNNDTYTSRCYVPTGAEITDTKYWARTANFNAQVEMYRRETAAAREVADNALAAANDAQGDIDTLLPKADFDAENTVKKYVDDSGNKRGQYLTFNKLGVLSQLEYVDDGYTSNVQGFAVDDTYMYYLIRNPTTEIGIIFKTNMSNGVIYQQNTISNIGHANSMAYDSKEEKLYIAPGFNSTSNMYEIIIVNPDTLQEEDRFEFYDTSYASNQYIRIGYNEDDGLTYLIAYDAFLTIDMTEREILSRTTFKYPTGYVTRDVTQGGCAYANYVGMICNDENTILFFDKNTGEYSHSFYVGYFQGGNVFPELEDASIHNDMIYVDCGGHNLMFFYHAPIYGGGYANSGGAALLVNGAASKTYYVNASTSDPYHADGTSTRPFKYLWQAVAAGNNPDYQYVTINIADGDYEEGLELRKKTFIIQGAGANTRVRYLRAYGCDVLCSNICFSGFCETTPHQSGTEKVYGAIYLESTRLSLQNAIATFEYIDTLPSGVTLYSLLARRMSTVYLFMSSQLTNGVGYDSNHAAIASQGSAILPDSYPSAANISQTGTVTVRRQFTDIAIGDSVTLPYAPFYSMIVTIPGTPYNKVPLFFTRGDVYNDLGIIIPCTPTPYVASINFNGSTGTLTLNNMRELISGTAVSDKTINVFAHSFA